MSNDALILQLAADLEPVGRRSTRREALLLLALAGAEAVLIVAVGLLRPDMGTMISSTYLFWKVGSLGLIAAVSCTAAMRSFSPPGSSPRGRLLTLGVIGVAVIAGSFLAYSTDTDLSLLARISPAPGMLCAVSIIVLSLPLLTALGVFMRRAAPVRPSSSALAAGLAAGTSGALVFTLCCPMNDPLYILVWYFVGCAAVAALSRWLLPRNFRL